MNVAHRLAEVSKVTNRIVGMLACYLLIEIVSRSLYERIETSY